MRTVPLQYSVTDSNGPNTEDNYEDFSGQKCVKQMEVGFQCGVVQCGVEWTGVCT